MHTFTLLIYIAAGFDTASPFYGFIFLVVPIYLFVGSFFLLGVSIVISWLLGKRKLPE